MKSPSAKADEEMKTGWSEGGFTSLGGLPLSSFLRSLTRFCSCGKVTSGVHYSEGRDARMESSNARAKRSFREKLRRGWKLFLIVVIALPVCFLLSLGRVESGQHMEPGYTMEVSGQWELTDSRAILPAAGSGGISASLEGDKLVYDFDGDGGHARAALYTAPPGELFCANDHIELAFPMEREADTEQTPGDIRCMFYLADGVTEADGVVTVDVREPFKYAYSGVKDMESITNETALTRRDRRLAVANTYFPEGREDGETLYIVMDVSDDRNAGMRTVLAWQYRWKQGPITVEVPPQPGIIEYYRAYSPLNIVFRVIAYILLVAVPVLLVRQLVLAGKAKKEKTAALPEDAEPDGSEDPSEDSK